MVYSQLARWRVRGKVVGIPLPIFSRSVVRYQNTGEVEAREFREDYSDWSSDKDTLRCSVQMTTTRSSSATSCCEYGVLNRYLQAGENRDGCADRRRESPSTHLIERRIELKARIVIIIATQISHY